MDSNIQAHFVSMLGEGYDHTGRLIREIESCIMSERSDLFQRTTYFPTSPIGI